MHARIGLADHERLLRFPQLTVAFIITISPTRKSFFLPGRPAVRRWNYVSTARSQKAAANSSSPVGEPNHLGNASLYHDQ